MSPSRREVIAGAGALSLAAIAGGAMLSRRSAAPAPDGLIPAGALALFLHGGGAASQAFADDLRIAAPGRVVDRQITPLTRKGFADAGRVLDAARGRTLVALLGDAEAVTVETMLRGRGAGILRRIVRTPAEAGGGGRVILAANL